MAAMLLTALMAMVCIIISKLIVALLREYKLVKGLKHDIAFLKDGISRVNALLADMDGMQELDVQQKECKVKLRELSFTTEECIDLFKYHLVEREDKPGFIDQLKALRVRHKIARKIRTLKARVAEVSHRPERYGLNDYITMPNQLPLVAIDPWILEHHEGTRFVGIDRLEHKTTMLLTEERPEAFRTQALFIVGCGGIGKSTLAKRVYHKIRGQFECSVFVSSASRSQSIKWIFEEMLSGLGFQGNTTLQNTDYQLLVDKLREYLKEKRYLVVIDDIWSEEAWNIISCPFIENNRGSRVVATTRHCRVVASAWLEASCFNGDVYEIEPLNDADSRDLFFGRVFYRSGDDFLEHLRNDLEQIVKKCGGVPLVILSLAGTLLANRNVVPTENWDEILSSLVYDLDRNPGLETMRYLLDLSYRDLCLNLRNCMLYFCMHQESSIISKDQLVRRWIAEGFVNKAYGCTQEEVAESYFNQLINRSIIQVADFDGHGQAISCRVHDVMLDFILSKAVEDNFFAIVGSQTAGESTEIPRIYFRVEHKKCDRVISSMDLSHARSLDFWACSKCQPSLSRFHLLRVLHLNISYSNYDLFGCDLTMICKLYLLRYLKITSSLGSVSSGFVRQTCRLPTQIRTLRYLKTLDIDANLLSWGFPVDVCEVTSLTNIIISSRLLPELPNGISKLKALRILKGFSILCCSLENIQGLGELSDLWELEVHVNAPEDAQVAAANSIHKLNKLKSLVIHCSGTKSRSNFGHHLRYWFPPRGLQRLHVHGCFFFSVPEWISRLQLLTSLVLGVARLTPVEFDVLAKLPSLVHLRLSIGQFFDHTMGVLRATEAKILIRWGMFSHLKSFWFRYEVPCDLMFEQGVMPSLESLGMRFVVERAVPSAPVLAGIEHLQRLTLFTVHIDSSSYQNRAFIDLYNRAVSNTCSFLERMWWAYYVRSAEAALTNAISCHQARPLVHIKYGENLQPEY